MGVISNIANEADDSFTVSKVLSGGYANGDTSLFNVFHPIRIVAFAGETTTNHSSEASDGKIFVDPTEAGLSNADLTTTIGKFEDITATTVWAINSSLVLFRSDGAAVSAALGFGQFYVPRGVIKLNLTAALASGAMKFTMTYYALSPEAHWPDMAQPGRAVSVV